MEKQGKRQKQIDIRVNQVEYEQIIKEYRTTLCRSLSEFTRKKLLGEMIVVSHRNVSLDGYTEQLAQLKTDLTAAVEVYNQAVEKLSALGRLKEIEHWLISYQLDKRALLQQVAKIHEFISKSAQQ